MTPGFANTRLPTAQIVADCWRDVLGLTASEGRNFFDLGGTSILAILLHTRLRERLPGCDFSIMTIFQHPTIAEFVEAIAPVPNGVSTAATVPVDRLAATMPPIAGVRTAAPAMSATERAQRQQQQQQQQQQPTTDGRPPCAGGKS